MVYKRTWEFWLAVRETPTEEITYLKGGEMDWGCTLVIREPCMALETEPGLAGCVANTLTPVLSQQATTSLFKARDKELKVAKKTSGEAKKIALRAEFHPQNPQGLPNMARGSTTGKVALQ